MCFIAMRPTPLQNRVRNTLKGSKIEMKHYLKAKRRRRASTSNCRSTRNLQRNHFFVSNLHLDRIQRTPEQKLSFPLRALQLQWLEIRALIEWCQRSCHFWMQFQIGLEDRNLLHPSFFAAAVSYFF